MTVAKPSTSAAALPASVHALDARMDEFMGSMLTRIDQIHVHLDADAMREAKAHRRAVAAAMFVVGVLGTLALLRLTGQL